MAETRVARAVRLGEVTWLRSWPSGHVHAFPHVSGHRAALCGVDPAVDTDAYPPGCATCSRCEAVAGPRPTEVPS